MSFPATPSEAFEQHLCQAWHLRFGMYMLDRCPYYWSTDIICIGAGRANLATKVQICEVCLCARLLDQIERRNTSWTMALPLRSAPSKLLANDSVKIMYLRNMSATEGTPLDVGRPSIGVQPNQTCQVQKIRQVENNTHVADRDDDDGGGGGPQENPCHRKAIIFIFIITVIITVIRIPLANTIEATTILMTMDRQISFF